MCGKYSRKYKIYQVFKEIQDIPYVTVHAERDHKSAILILIRRRTAKTANFILFFFFRSGDAEGFIESSQLFQSC